MMVGSVVIMLLGVPAWGSGSGDSILHSSGDLLLTHYGPVILDPVISIWCKLSINVSNPHSDQRQCDCVIVCCQLNAAVLKKSIMQILSSYWTEFSVTVNFIYT